MCELPGSDRVDADRGELDCQSANQAFGRPGPGGREGRARNRSLSDGAGGQGDRAFGPDPRGGVLDDGDRAPEPDVEDGVRIAQGEISQPSGRERVARGEHHVVDFAAASEQRYDPSFIADVDDPACASFGQFAQRGVYPFAAVTSAQSNAAARAVARPMPELPLFRSHQARPQMIIEHLLDRVPVRPHATPGRSGAVRTSRPVPRMSREQRFRLRFGS